MEKQEKLKNASPKVSPLSDSFWILLLKYLPSFPFTICTFLKGKFNNLVNWNISQIKVGNSNFIFVIINNRDPDDPDENGKKAFTDELERRAHGMVAPA